MVSIIKDDDVVKINIPDIHFNLEWFSDRKADASDIVNFTLKFYLPTYERE
ncbi:hypothetical protein CHY_2648 [Carboxydothermus hydrogenoformans Z-2901]|uniref:Uncharacterized protein n=1 Tax=Carboxydothermus hydrogenoformans (strain ATCC BAA-161 / DSM 6008 / Z-2901) TaxID=246194 RepID=Q3A8U4_CARHZ|nr:hypothetical protein CHY_2648 [Carboxydothermus hydrogenoformans Z-2901]